MGEVLARRSGDNQLAATQVDVDPEFSELEVESSPLLRRTSGHSRSIALARRVAFRPVRQEGVAFAI